MLLVDVNNPDISTLLINFDLVLICITSFIGIFAVSASLEGYFLTNMKWYERILSAAGGLLLIYPGLVTDLIGVALIAVPVILQVVKSKSNRFKAV